LTVNGKNHWPDKKISYLFFTIPSSSNAHILKPSLWWIMAQFCTILHKFAQFCTICTIFAQFLYNRQRVASDESKQIQAQKDGFPHFAHNLISHLCKQKIPYPNPHKLSSPPMRKTAGTF
jgi:hypothetical protein